MHLLIVVIAFDRYCLHDTVGQGLASSQLSRVKGQAGLFGCALCEMLGKVD